MRKLIVAVSLIAVIGWLAPADLSAQQGGANQTLQARTRLEFDTARGQRIQNRCETIKTRLNNLRDGVGGLKGRRDGFISGMLAKLTAFSDRAGAAGLDVTELKSDLAQLKTLTDQSATAWDAYLTALDGVLKLDCAADSEAFHDALEDAKTAHDELKSKAKAVRDFFLSDIKADLMAIRQQLADQQTDDGDQPTSDEGA